MRAIPPYIPNFTKVSCQQSVYAMILQTITGVVQSPEAVNALCNSEKGKWTWHFSPMYKLAQSGYKVSHVSDFNISAFVQNPMDYLISFQGEENAHTTIDNSNMGQVLEDAQMVLDNLSLPNLNIITKKPTIDDLHTYLEKGYLLSQWINSAAIEGRKDDYNGHYVMLYDVDDRDVTFHNPGGFKKNGSPRNHNKAQVLSHERFMECIKLPHAGLSEGFTAIKPL